MASGPITSWEIDGETVETVAAFIFLGSKITVDGDYSHEIKRRLLLGRKVMTNLDSILKRRDITLSTKVKSESEVAQLCPTLCDPMNPAHQASLSITSSRSLPKLMSIESVMLSKHFILFRPFSSCPQSFPASETFPMSQLFASGGQSIGVSDSTSVLPMNTQD